MCRIPIVSTWTRVCVCFVEMEEGNDIYVHEGDFRLKVTDDQAKLLKSYVGKQVTFGIRPEDVYDSQIAVDTLPKDASFDATIKVYELLGAEVFLYFDLGEFPMTARVDPRTTAQRGSTCTFVMDTEKIHVFDKETEQIITN